jgi:hypothetical protein
MENGGVPKPGHPLFIIQALLCFACPITEKESVFGGLIMFFRIAMYFRIIGKYARKFYWNYNKTFAHAKKLLAHAKKLFAHATKHFAHATKHFAHAKKLFAHAKKTFAHAKKTFTHAKKPFAHPEKTCRNFNKNYFYFNNSYKTNKKWQMVLIISQKMTGFF